MTIIPTMYTAYWGLAEAPFRNNLDPRWFFESAGHEEALARLLYLVEHERRCGVVAGGSGTGKSLLLELVKSEAARAGAQAAVVDLLGKSGREMLWEIVAALGLGPGADDAPQKLWRRLQDRITVNHHLGRPLVLLFDHLERAHAECLEAIERLQQLSAPGRAAFTLILAVRSERSHDLLLRRLREMSDVRIELAPFDREQTRGYVETLLTQAGAERPLFDDSAFERLFEETHGVPREINRLCELSLLAGMAEQAGTIDGTFVAAAAEELRGHFARTRQPALAEAR